VSAPTAGELRALARKYRTLAELRRDRERDGTVGPRPVLRALAREFPGALRELDTLPLDEIDRRVAALDAAAEGRDAGEPWMAWMIAYHATMRAALSVKARVARAGDDAALAAVAVSVSQKLGVVIDVAFVAAVANPPGGRLNRVVFQRLSAVLGADAEEMWETLFPSRRRDRYGC
jgi:hypothetical protein